jgi:hypothetical protein
LTKLIGKFRPVRSSRCVPKEEKCSRSSPLMIICHARISCLASLPCQVERVLPGHHLVGKPGPRVHRGSLALSWLKIAKHVSAKKLSVGVWLVAWQEMLVSDVHQDPCFQRQVP